ncbi:MAG TPA: tetratricopeptide repeat protein [Acidobacteriota bacterium]|jgi:tetratricopeptide (TPR) repeat protein
MPMHLLNPHSAFRIPQLSWCLGVLVVSALVVPLRAQVPPDVQTLIRQAQQDRDQRKLAEAETELKQALQLDERNKLAREALVDVLMRQGRWNEAVSNVQLLRLYFPQNGDVAFLAAAVAFRTGQFPLASKLAAECLSRGDHRAEVYKILALSRFMLNDYEGFKINISALLARNPDDADAHYHLGRYNYEVKNYVEGINAFKKTVQLDPDYFKAYYFMALCLQAGGDPDESKKNFRKAIEIIERKKIAYGWPFADLGELLVGEGRYEDGLGWLYRGIRNDSGLPYTHFKYASALLKKEESSEIEGELQSAIRLDPNYAEAYYLLGRYYNKINDREKAQAAFAKFDQLKKNPQPSPFGVRR